MKITALTENTRENILVNADFQIVSDNRIDNRTARILRVDAHKRQIERELLPRIHTDECHQNDERAERCPNICEY